MAKSPIAKAKVAAIPGPDQVPTTRFPVRRNITDSTPHHPTVRTAKQKCFKEVEDDAKFMTMRSKQQASRLPHVARYASVFPQLRSRTRQNVNLTLTRATVALEELDSPAAEDRLQPRSRSPHNEGKGCAATFVSNAIAASLAWSTRFSGEPNARGRAVGKGASIKATLRESIAILRPGSTPFVELGRPL